MGRDDLRVEFGERGVQPLSGTGRHRLAEGPQYWSDGTLTWVDILAGTLTVARPEPGSGCPGIQHVHRVSGLLGTAVRCASGGFVLAVDQSLVYCDDSGTVSHLATIDSGPTRLNDGKCDPAGRFWVGSVSEVPGGASLFRIDIDGSVNRALTGLTTSNGIGWNQHHTVMYLVDSTPRTVDAFDYDIETGAIDNRRTIIRLPAAAGVPDGLAVDDEGYLWIAIWDGAAIHRYRSDGQLVGTLQLPTRRPTACCFGGPDGATLWITTAREGVSAPVAIDGMVLRHQTATSGPQARPFAGNPRAIGQRRTNRGGRRPG